MPTGPWGIVGLSNYFPRERPSAGGLHSTEENCARKTTRVPFKEEFKEELNVSQHPEQRFPIMATFKDGWTSTPRIPLPSLKLARLGIAALESQMSLCVCVCEWGVCVNPRGPPRENSQTFSTLQIFLCRIPWGVMHVRARSSIVSWKIKEGLSGVGVGGLPQLGSHHL